MSRPNNKTENTRRQTEIEQIAKVKKKLFMETQSVSEAAPSNKDDFIIIPLLPGDEALILAGELEVFDPKAAEKYSVYDSMIPPENEVSELVKNYVDRSRKRRRMPENWKRNIAKKKREAGEEYISTKGNLRQAKTVKSACQRSCHFKCSSNFSFEQRQQVKTDFYSLTDSQKAKFYGSYTVKKGKGRKRTKNGESRRKFSFEYFLPKQECKVSVCKTFFCATLDISVHRIYYFHFKTTESKLSLAATPAKGKHIKKVTPAEKIYEVKEHIKSFPTVESHYCRSSSSRQYLSSGLSVAKMYSLYTEKHEDPVKENIYRKVFCENFNLSFHRPKKDACDLCSEFKAQNNPSEELKEKHKRHEERKKAGKEERTKDRNLKNSENNDTAVLTFDLENIFTLPKATVSCFFYTSKLTVYNLTAHCDVTKSAFNALWDETRNGRTGDDLASALVKILKKVVLTLPDTITKLILWSDSCVPQNRNSHMSMALITFLQSDDSKKISTITQKFSEPGHGTVQEVDAVHSLIERNLRHLDIYSPISLLRALLKIHSKALKFTFMQMEDDDFLSYHNEAVKYGFNQIPYTQVKSLTYSKSGWHLIQYQTSFGSSLQTVNINKLRIQIINDILIKGPQKTLTKKRINDIRSTYKYMPAEDRACMEALMKKSEKIGREVYIENSTVSDSAETSNSTDIETRKNVAGKKVKGSNSTDKENKHTKYSAKLKKIINGKKITKRGKDKK